MQKLSIIPLAGKENHFQGFLPYFAQSCKLFSDSVSKTMPSAAQFLLNFHKIAQKQNLFM
jgi:hypothetical protein